MKTQSESILHYLKSNTITAIEALNLFGCFRLAARIADLRDEGHMIITENLKVNGKRIARYRLVK